MRVKYGRGVRWVQIHNLLSFREKKKKGRKGFERGAISTFLVAKVELETNRHLTIAVGNALKAIGGGGEKRSRRHVNLSKRGLQSARVGL